MKPSSIQIPKKIAAELASIENDFNSFKIMNELMDSVPNMYEKLVIQIVEMYTGLNFSTSLLEDFKIISYVQQPGVKQVYYKNIRVGFISENYSGSSFSIDFTPIKQL